MKVDFHSHAMARMGERGATAAQVRQTVQRGRRTPAKFGRTKFSRTFEYNKLWCGRHYGRKTIEAYAVQRDCDHWLVITVIVKYF
jgi:hypothetical protein